VVWRKHHNATICSREVLYMQYTTEDGNFWIQIGTAC